MVVLISWPLWIFSGVLTRARFFYDYRWLISQIGVFAPTISALIISAVKDKKLRRNSLRILPVILFSLFIPGIFIAMATPEKVSEFPALPAIISIVVALIVIFFFMPIKRNLLLPGTGRFLKRTNTRWILLSVSAFPILFLLAWLFVSLPGGIHPPALLQSNIRTIIWGIGVIFSHNLLLGGSLGEEIGWRGFLLPRLLEKYNPLAASIVLGVIWGLWHFPIDIYSGFLIKGPASVILRLMWVIPVSVIFTWFYLRCDGNLLIPLLMHTSLNILPDLGFPNYEVTLVFLFLLLLTVAILLSLFDPKFKQGLK